MKKVIWAQLIVLLLVLLGAVAVLFMLSRPAVSGQDEADKTQMEQQTQEQEQEDEAATGEEEQEEEPFVPTWKTYPDTRALLAQQYFVYDCNTGTFLISSGTEEERIYPASVTKLFTAYVALQYLQPDGQITAGGELDYVAWGSSVAKLQMGDVLTVGQLVEAMMLPSGNDAAYVLAAAAGRVIADSPEMDAGYAVEVFMNQMNLQAASLGMTGTHFVNPDGIHDGEHYTSFKDLAVLGKLAMDNPTIMAYTGVARETVTLHGETVEWKNTNALVDPQSAYYCPYALGLKTGQTPSAGSCLLSAFRYEEHALLIGVFGCPEENDRFDDTLQLFNSIVLDPVA